MGLIRNLVSRLSGDGGNVRRSSSSSSSSDGGRDGRRERKEREKNNRRSDGGGASRAAAPQQAIRVDEQHVNRDAMVGAYALLQSAVQVGLACQCGVIIRCLPWAMHACVYRFSRGHACHACIHRFPHQSNTGDIAYLSPKAFAVHPLQDLAAADELVNRPAGLINAAKQATSAAMPGEGGSTWGEAGRTLGHDGRVDAKHLVASAHDKYERASNSAL